MEIITREPSDDSWVGAKGDLVKGHYFENKRTLNDKLKSVDMWFMDLDDNHAPSPAKIIAKRGWGVRKREFLTYLLWCLGTGSALLDGQKGAESKRWKKYVGEFLQDEEARIKVGDLFTPEVVQKSLYPGVEEFCRGRGFRTYVTRNISEVAAAYARFLDFGNMITEAYDKGKAIENFLVEKPWIKKVGIEGDSEEDGEMISVAKRRGLEIVSIYSMDKPGEMDSRFDYAVSKSRMGLLGMLD
jgi:hypothetical protein